MAQHLLSDTRAMALEEFVKPSLLRDKRHLSSSYTCETVTVPQDEVAPVSSRCRGQPNMLLHWAEPNGQDDSYRYMGLVFRW
jgi:hypothetical protein